MATRYGSNKYYQEILGLSDKTIRRTLKTNGGREKLDILVSANKDPTLRLPYSPVEPDKDKPPYEIVNLRDKLSQDDIMTLLSKKNDNTLLNLASFLNWYSKTGVNDVKRALNEKAKIAIDFMKLYNSGQN